MTKDEALKLALEALENSVDLVREDAYQAEKLYGNYPTRQGKVNGLKVLADDHEKAITALRQAIEEADKPRCTCGSHFAIGFVHRRDKPCFVYEERVWTRLTDEDRTEVFNSLPDALEGFLNTWGWLHFAKAVEAKLREKNT